LHKRILSLKRSASKYSEVEKINSLLAEIQPVVPKKSKLIKEKNILRVCRREFFCRRQFLKNPQDPCLDKT